MVAELEAEEEVHRSGGRLVSEYRHVIVDPQFVCGVGGGEGGGGRICYSGSTICVWCWGGCAEQVCVAVNERSVWG